VVSFNQNQVFISCILGMYLGRVARVDKVVFCPCDEQGRDEAVVDSLDGTYVLDAKPCLFLHSAPYETHCNTHYKTRNLYTIEKEDR